MIDATIPILPSTALYQCIDGIVRVEDVAAAMGKDGETRGAEVKQYY
jgi:hypothetical protein